MKSIYNIPQVKTQNTTSITPIGQLTDVSLSGVTNKQGLVYNSGPGKWTNQNIVNSFNTRTGDITLTENDIKTLDNSYYVQDYTFSTTVTAVKNTHHTLRFGGTITVDPLNVGEHILISADANIVTVNFSGISFVTNAFTGGSISNPVFSLLACSIELVCVLNAGQTYYNIIRVSQSKTNAVCTLNSVKISDIGSLNNIPDVDINSVSNGQYLTYSSGKWINSNGTNYTNIIQAVSNQTMVLQTIYIGKTNPVSLSIPTCSNLDCGKKILVVCGDNNTTNVIIPSGIFLNGVSNFTTTSAIGTIEIVVSGTNAYQINSVIGGFLNNSLKKYVVSNLEDLHNVALTSLSNNQILKYSSPNWVNSENVFSFNGRIGSVVSATNDYSISQIQNASFVATNANLVVSGIQTGDHLYYTGGNFLNKPFVGYVNVINATANLVMSLQNIYVCKSNPLNFDLPLGTTLSDSGKRVLLSCADSNQANLSVPSGISLNNIPGPYVIQSAFGSIEIICTSANQFQIIAVDGNWARNNKRYDVTSIEDLSNVNLTGPSSGQYLQFDGSNWINSNLNAIRVYNASGLINTPKVYLGTGTTNGVGICTINMSPASFSNVYAIQATAILGGTSASNAPLASVQSFSVSSVNIIVVESNTVFLGGQSLNVVGSGIVVHIIAFGN